MYPLAQVQDRQHAWIHVGNDGVTRDVYEGMIVGQIDSITRSQATKALGKLAAQLIKQNIAVGLRITNRGYSGHLHSCRVHTRLLCSHGINYGRSDLISLEPGAPMTTLQITKASNSTQLSTDWFRARARRVTGM